MYLLRVVAMMAKEEFWMWWMMFGVEMEMQLQLQLFVVGVGGERRSSAGWPWVSKALIATPGHDSWNKAPTTTKL